MPSTDTVPPISPADEPRGALELVALFDGTMPNGITVSHRGRIFVNYPKRGDAVRFCVAELRDGECVPNPDEATNRTDPNHPAAALVSVQSVVVDPAGRDPEPADAPGSRAPACGLRRAVSSTGVWQ